MKKKFTSGNLFNESDGFDNFSFVEEFDSDLVANRGEGVDALSDDDYIEKEFDSKKPVLSKEDLAELSAKSAEAKHAAELLNKFGLNENEKEESSLITKEDAENIDDIRNLYDSDTEITDTITEKKDSDDTITEKVYYETEDGEDFDEIKHLLSEDEKEKLKKTIKIKKRKTPEQIQDEKIQSQKNFEKEIFNSLYSDDYSETDEFKDKIMLEKDFVDLIKARRIEKKHSVTSPTNLLDSKEIKSDKKFVEITHAPNLDKPTNTHEMSTVEINRDEYGEIENIIVICKCGEKTLIKFDYAEEDDEDLTIFDDDTSENEKIDHDNDTYLDFDQIDNIAEEEQNILENDMDQLQEDINNSFENENINSDTDSNIDNIENQDENDMNIDDIEMQDENDINLDEIQDQNFENIDFNELDDSDLDDLIDKSQ